MLWEQFRSLALPLLGEHFPPNLVKDNGDSLTFVDRRERQRFFLTESAQGITIGDYEERNTVGIIFTSPSGLVWFCGPGVLRVVGCYWWCCAHWRAYWLGESQPSALWGCSSL